MREHPPGQGSAAGNATTTITAIATCLGLAVAWWRMRPGRTGGDPLPGMLAALAVLLALSPTVHLWYLVWLVPLTALMPATGWLLLWLSAGAYYVTVEYMQQTGIWQLPGAWFVVEWLPLYALLLQSGRRWWQRRSRPPMPGWREAHSGRCLWGVRARGGSSS